MSDAPQTPDAAPKKGLPPAALLAIALVAGLAAGGAAGAFAVGPALAEGIAPAVAATARHTPKAAAHGEDGAAAGDEAEEGEAGEEGAAKGEEHGKEGEPAVSLVYTMDNLVLNPAESGGTRFLLFTVAFELRTQALLDAMKARDAEMRDVVIATIGQRTTEELADMVQRDSLKAQLSTAVARELRKKKAVKRVYFPQFVIQ